MMYVNSKHIYMYVDVCVYVYTCMCVYVCVPYQLWLIQFFRVTTILIMLHPGTEQLHVSGGRTEETRLSIVGVGNYKIQGKESRMIYVV